MAGVNDNDQLFEYYLRAYAVTVVGGQLDASFFPSLVQQAVVSYTTKIPGAVALGVNDAKRATAEPRTKAEFLAAHANLYK